MSLSPERRLILHFMTHDAGRPKTARLRDLPSLAHLNWNDFLLQAERHGLSGLLFHRLAKFDALSSVPEYVLEGIRDGYDRTMASNICLLSAFERIARAFREDGIPFILMKGLDLVQWLYGSVGMRPMMDIDLLVRREDVRRCRAVLASLGYSPPDATDPETYLEKHRHIQYRSRNIPPVFLELHWDLSHETYFRFDLERIWKASRLVDVSKAGERYLRLPMIDHLLLLCLHLARNFTFLRLMWIADISEILKRFGPVGPWEELIRLGRQQGLLNALYFSLRYARLLFDAPVPKGLLSRLGVSRRGELFREPIHVQSQRSASYDVRLGARPARQAGLWAAQDPLRWQKDAHHLTETGQSSQANGEAAPWRSAYAAMCFRLRPNEPFSRRRIVSAWTSWTLATREFSWAGQQKWIAPSGKPTM